MAFFKKNINEKSSYEELYNRYHHRVFAYLSNKISNRDDMMDVMQDIFMHLWEHKITYTTENAEAIIFNISKHKVADFYRKNKIVQTDEKPSPILVESINEDIEALEQLELDIQILNENISQLLPLRREILVLNKFEGIPQSKIAQRFNLSRSAVENQLSKALATLRNNHNKS